MSELSIVVPAYNEEQRLPATLDSIIRYLQQSGRQQAEVLIVDDGSKDRTTEVVRGFQASWPLLRLLSNPGNRGKGYSVRHGMLEASGDFILSTDADLSAPIEELDKLLEASREHNADVAIGSRALDRSLILKHQPVFREYSGRVFNWFMRQSTGLQFRDTQCGFKVFRRGAAHEIFRRQQLDGFGFDVEDLFIAQLLGFRAVEVPVRWSNAEGTKVTLAHGLNTFLDVLRVRRNQLRGLYR